MNAERDEIVTSDGAVFDRSTMDKKALRIAHGIIAQRFADHAWANRQDAIDAAVR